MTLVSIKRCPPGLFRFDGALCLMTEYSKEVVIDGKMHLLFDAYVADSGESFWGGATSLTEYIQLMVEPLDNLPPEAVNALLPLPDDLIFEEE